MERAPTLRDANRLRILDVLRREGRASRGDLARMTGLSRSTVAGRVGAPGAGARRGRRRARGAEPLLRGIRDTADRYAQPGTAEAVEVRPGVLGERAEVLGALALVIRDTRRIGSGRLVALAGEAPRAAHAG